MTLQPVALHTFQSPTTTPAVTRVEATPPASPLATPDSTMATPHLPSAQSAGGGGASVSPLIWIVVGLILGGAIVFLTQRASPHDS